MSRIKMGIFALMLLLLAVPSGVLAGTDSMHVHRISSVELHEDQFNAVSHRVDVGDHDILNMEAYNDVTSQGFLYYRVMRERELMIQDEGPMMLHDTVCQGRILPGESTSRKIMVGPGKYILELYSHYIIAIPSLPIAMGHGQAVLMSIAK